jgi:hypothetical protein
MSFGIPVRNGLAIGLLSSTTLSSNGGLFPAMALDFLQPFLDSRVTFTRGSNATLVDSTGKIVYAPANLVTYSEQFDNAAWIKYEGTVTANATTAPDGTTTADAFIESTTATTDHRLTFAGASAAVGQNLTLSVYAKANGRNFIALFSVTENKGKYFSIPADGTGAVLGDFGTAPNSAAISYVGNGWYRCSITYTATAASQNVRYYPCDTGATFIYTGNGTSGIFVWGAQLQPVTYQTTPSTYVATTSAAYYGPRFDYDPVTLAAKGLLIEEQRTNLFTYSEQFDNVIWTKVRATVTANATTSPNGAVNADKLVENTDNNTHYVEISPTVTAVAHSFSVFLKAGERTWARLVVVDGAAYFNLSTGAVGTVSAGSVSLSALTPVNMGNGWYRCTVVFTPSAGAATLQVRLATSDGGQTYTGDGTSGIYVWGAQLELGAFATSYIPTVASTVTRSADNASMTGTNFSSWYNQTEGTFVVGADTAQAASNRILEASGGLTARVVDLLVATGQVLQMYNGTTTFNASGSVTLNTPFKAVGAYKTADYGVALNGGTVTANTAALVNTANALQIGRFNTPSNYLNGHLQAISYYNSRLPDATLQALTV